MSENEELFLNQKTREFVLQRAEEKKNGKITSTLSETLEKIHESNVGSMFKEYLRKDISDFNGRVAKMNLSQLKDEHELTKAVIVKYMDKMTETNDAVNMKLSVYVRRAKLLFSLIAHMEKNNQTEQQK